MKNIFDMTIWVRIYLRNVRCNHLIVFCLTPIVDLNCFFFSIQLTLLFGFLSNEITFTKEMSIAMFFNILLFCSLSKFSLFFDVNEIAFCLFIHFVHFLVVDNLNLKKTRCIMTGYLKFEQKFSDNNFEKYQINGGLETSYTNIIL